MTISSDKLQCIIEAALMVAGHPLTVADIQKLFSEEDMPAKDEIRAAIDDLINLYKERGVALQEVASGFQFQARADYAPWISRLWEERAPRYSRAILETLALIAYRQPITRSEIEEIRGVAVSTHIIKTLQDRDWIKVVGIRDVPGRPELLATTKVFLDHLNLKTLADLPPLAEILDLEKQEEKLHVQLELQPDASTEASSSEEESVVSEVSEETHAETETHEEEFIHEEINLDEDLIFEEEDTAFAPPADMSPLEDSREEESTSYEETLDELSEPVE